MKKVFVFLFFPFVLSCSENFKDEKDLEKNEIETQDRITIRFEDSSCYSDTIFFQPYSLIEKKNVVEVFIGDASLKVPITHGKEYSYKDNPFIIIKEGINTITFVYNNNLTKVQLPEPINKFRYIKLYESNKNELSVIFSCTPIRLD